MSIPIFCPSKDRAAQLLLLLESFEKNCPGLFQPHIMYTWSNDEFREAYWKVMLTDVGKKCIWRQEDNGKKQFYQFLRKYSGKNSIIGLFSDDCIFYRDCDICEDDIHIMFWNEDLFTFTFRVGRNTTIKDYVIQDKAVIPLILNDEEPLMKDSLILWWDYTKLDFWQLFGFPVGFDGYLYRANDLLELSQEDHFPRICEWEHMICKKFLVNPSKRKLMSCPKQSGVVVQQINTVHGLPHRTTGQWNVSPQILNQKLLNGFKIDLSSMDFSGVNCSHAEIKFDYASFV